MSDEYPRVAHSDSAVAHGWKVVPADAIVIERDELPEVDAEAYRNGSFAIADPVEAARTLALHYLAVAEYLAAHPPVDEAQVDALQDALMTAARERPHTDAWRDVASALVRDGWHKDVTP